MPTETKAWICENNGSSIRCKLTFHLTHEIFDKGIQACSTTNRHLIASGTDQKKPIIYIWEKKVGCSLRTKDLVILKVST